MKHSHTLLLAAFLFLTCSTRAFSQRLLQTEKFETKPLSTNLHVGHAAAKCPMSDDSLLDLVQSQTFKYFWNFGHPKSGMARERSNNLFATSNDVVTTGGSGFGVMAILVGIERNFITKKQGLDRVTKIVNFLTDSAEHFHGAFSHWMNGKTGKTIPFAKDDNGADLVETSYMMEGLLCAREYFNGNSQDETELRKKINKLWNGVDWTFFTRKKNVLFWLWSPDHGWADAFKIEGWDEALITYILAASSNTHAIPAIVYENGWAQNGAIENGKKYYGVTLPLGQPKGGPLFFTHYTFMGIDPHGLKDQYADYWQQDTSHARINYLYCVKDPKGYTGYSDSCWGLTASDIDSGYTASCPGNDVGVIAPTAAVSSLPYLPKESMAAIRYFYYTLGNKLWGQYGFYDAFDLTTGWYDNGDLAIDEGPEINMIENYRTGLLWHLLMNCPEVQRGLKTLGFSSPYFK
jgi:hypothetical protein